MSSSPTLRIAIDGNEANISQRVGSNAYAYELLIALEKLTEQRGNINCTILLAQPPQADLPAKRQGWSYQVVQPGPLWTQIGLPIHLFLHRQDYDVFFTPGHYGPRVSTIPYVSSVMDLSFLEYPNQFKRKDYLQLREWTRYSVKHAAKLVAISQFTKADIVKRYGRDKKDIVVAYPALLSAKPSEIKDQSSRVLSKFEIFDQYILYVGTLQPRKNLLNLVEAFEKVVSDCHPDRNPAQLQLVIAGKVGWLAEPLLEKIKNSRFTKRIILTGYVTEAEKEVLYRNSITSVLIGFYEGFGIPALEAMAFGTVPLVSATTSLPEVVEKAGFQVDPGNVTAIVKKLKEIIGLPAKERAQFLRLGREQVENFSWAESAKVVLETLEKVAKRDKSS